jgi:hypothetical protein
MGNRLLIGFMVAWVGAVQLGCSTDSSEGSTSEVAASLVSGALNNTTGSKVAFNGMKARPSPLRRLLESLQPISEAWAAVWACTGGTLSPSFSGSSADPYSYTPLSCSVTWANGKTGSSQWSGPFSLSYGTSCDDTHAWIDNQAADCTLTRTTPTGGITRTVTGVNGNTYAVTHDTNGLSSGWDTSVSPAPSNGGVVASCEQGGCSVGRSLVVNGSHLSATENGSLIWNHTLSTAGSGLTVSGAGAARTVNGALTVQHNILQYTAVATFSNVGYGDVDCCFPTTGTVTSTFSNGPNQGKNETLSFSSVCGEATLATATGGSVALTLQHCL